MYEQFARYYDLIFPFRDATYRFLRSWLKNDQNRILDLGCGTGGYLARFAQEGHEVAGIDLNETMLHMAKQRCPQGTWLALNLKNLDELPARLPRDRNERFDLIFCTGNVLSYLAPDELARTIGAIFNLLNPLGHWIFQVVNWQKILRQSTFVFPVIENREQRVRFIRAYNNLTPAGAIFHTRLEKDGKIIFEDAHRLFAHNSHDLQALHEKNNFKKVGFYGDFKKAPFQPEVSGALIGVFKKEN
ncbi:class I SAM-dependent DNA methyltransferase [Calditrichota bacterium LG25]